MVDQDLEGANVVAIPDAYLAALAIEYGLVLQTTDRDFARFSGLSGKILSRRAGPPMPENHGSKGFMNFGAEILGLVFLGVTYGILVPVLIRWIDSGAIITVVCVLLFVPLFMASFGLADVLTGFESGKEREKKREEEEQRRQARHRERRGRRKSR